LTSVADWFSTTFCHFWRGDVAQLVERLLCKQNVAGSIPVISTNLAFKNSDIGLLLGGAVLGICPDFEIEPFNSIVFPL
jgi:hypothetical protein